MAATIFGAKLYLHEWMFLDGLHDSIISIMLQDLLLLFPVDVKLNLIPWQCQCQ